MEAIASNVQPAELTDRDRVLNLGLRTIEAVARQIHPQDRNPLWKFTIPEALALVERVSADLRPFVIDNIPLGDQLTVGQVLKIYGWRSAIGMAEKAYDIWRLIRLVNPVTAAAQEAREQITKHLYANVRDQLARQLAGAYVREVGRAAIDLYGGRLRVTQAQLAGHVSASTLRDRGKATGRAEPLRILIAGQAGAGKSSLVNALSKRGARRGRCAGRHARLPGLRGGARRAQRLDGDRQPARRRHGQGAESIRGEGERQRPHRVGDRRRQDRRARATWRRSAGIRKHYAGRPHRRQPPILVALTHIDKLMQRMPGPHEAIDASDPAVVEVVRVVAEGLGMPKNDVVPVSLAPGRAPYNIEQLAGRIAARVPEARQAQLLRLMEDAAPRWSVRRLLGQAGNAALSAAQDGHADASCSGADASTRLTKRRGSRRAGGRFHAHGLDLLGRAARRCRRARCRGNSAAPRAGWSPWRRPRRCR